MRVVASCGVLCAALVTSVPVSAEVDVEAAKLLFKQNECGKCHNPDKNKKGPSLRKIAKDYKGKGSEEQEIIRSLTIPRKIKLEDGNEEDHKVVDSSDAKAIGNLARWILGH